VTFQEPAFLLAIALVPLGAAAYLIHERRASGSRAAFASPALQLAISPRRAGWRRHAPMVAYAIALAVLAVALARPRVTVAVPVQRATVVLVTDRSGSMQARDVQPSRLGAARRAALTFLGQLPPAVKVGAIGYNQLPEALQSPTTDREALRAALDSLEPAGSTATGEALALALQMTDRGARKPAPAAIVLLSDGKSVRGRDPLDVAREIAAAKVPVYTVALGTATGTIESKRPDGTTRLEPVPPDPATLEQIAEITGGRSFDVADAARLQEIYARLGRQVATERRPREITAAFAGGALLLIATGALASLRWFGRLV
jgi:Ca-activated chloride channel family protein